MRTDEPWMFYLQSSHSDGANTAGQTSSWNNIAIQHHNNIFKLIISKKKGYLFIKQKFVSSHDHP